MIYAFIPARYESTRFLGKILTKIKDKTMLEWVYKGVKESKLVDKIVILTDDTRILEEANSFIENNDTVVMTPKNLNSGTERIAYFINNNKEEADKISFVLNIQGDEPLIDGKTVDILANLSKDLDNLHPMATLCKESKSIDEFEDKNTVKLVIDAFNNALYFSRAGIPCSKTELDSISFLKHVGLYLYKKDFLNKYLNLKSKKLENIESLEQLRVLENGFKIKVAKITKELISVDTVEDLKKLNKHILKF